MSASARHHPTGDPVRPGPDADRLDGQMLAGLEQDDRLASGLHGLPRASDLEFIQMTGITRTRSTSDSRTTGSDDPMSFYEAGVVDVDERMAPGGILETGESGGGALAETAPRSRSAEALRELIAELRPDEVSARSAPLEALPEESRQSVSMDPETPGEEGEPDAGVVTGMPGEASSDFDDAGASEAEMHWQAPEDVPEASALDALVALLGGDEPEDKPVEQSPSFEDTEDTLELPAVDEALGGGESGAPGPDMPSDTEDAESDTPSEFSATPEARLAQAEELLRALEDQPRLSTDDATAEPFPWPANELGDAAGRDIQEPALPPIRRTGRLLGVLMLLLFSGALLAGGVWGYVHYVAPRLAGMTGDEPDAEALFRAAIAAQLEPAADEGAARDRDRRALGRFEAFAGAYPAHPKAPRARVLMGVLQHRLGDHAQAVRTLTPFLQAGPPGPDPEGWVPAMRTMARSLARLGRYSEAAETYRAAVVSPSNSTPEVDYEELGSLMLEWASAHGDEAGRELLPRAAAEYWGIAIAVPGIDPLERARIQQQRDALLEQLREADAASTPAVQPAEIPED